MMVELIQASEYRFVIQDVAVLIIALLAVGFGSWPERAAIAVWLFCLEIPSFIYREWMGNQVLLTGADAFLVSVDVAACFAWIMLALYANRNYTLWIAGAQLVAIAAHVARALVETISPIAYSVMVIAPGWIQLLAMAAGITRHILRQRKYGAYRDWRISRTPIRFEAFRDAERSLGSESADTLARKGQH